MCKTKHESTKALEVKAKVKVSTNEDVDEVDGVDGDRESTSSKDDVDRGGV